MPQPFNLRVQMARPVSPPTKSIKKAMTAAERKKLSRQRQKEMMSVEERKAYLNRERDRVCLIRDTHRSTDDGQKRLKEQMAQWNHTKRYDVSRQKQVAQREQSKLSKREKRGKNNRRLSNIQHVAEVSVLTLSSEKSGESAPTAGPSILHTPPSMSRITKWRYQKAATEALDSMTPKTKSNFLCKTIDVASPRTKRNLDKAGILTGSDIDQADRRKVICDLQTAFKSLTKHDNLSNTVKKTLVQGVSGTTTSGRAVARLFGVG